MASSSNGSESASVAARQHIEEIRRSKFSIGAAEPNPLTEDLHHAVRNLSAELYSKDVHFLMELIQNAEDNEYSSNVTPTLEFVITPKDITGTGASTTLIVFNNEVGFSKRNIESICSVGRSTKKEKKHEGYIGEKGIGFKSVFLVTSQPYIFSNGYQISFTEEPDPCCCIGYIVPKWVDAKPTTFDIHNIYGFDNTLPTTVVILPLKTEKVNAVKQQLSMVHPEILLFLSKIKRLSVRESKNDTEAADTVAAISISSETDFRTRKDVNADSHIVYLSAQEGTARVGTDCHYYIWRQRFPVKHEHMVEARKNIHEWVISLAFPFGERLKRGRSSAGIYAFLPTEMVTNFPFIIQADFILASSRETILLDNKWNGGILDRVPDAFINAFVASVKSVEVAPMSSVAQTFKFLPVKHSSYAALRRIREAIKNMMQAEYVIPCESFSDNRIFCRPGEAGRLFPDFRDILFKFGQQGVSLMGISSHGKFVLHSALDLREFNDVLKFLGISYMCYNWYGKCIQGSNLVLQASEDLYLELLCFLSANWCQKFEFSTVKNLPVLKYVDQNNKVATRSFLSAAHRTNKIFFARNYNLHVWLKKWNVEFGCTEMVFLPNTTVMALEKFRARDAQISQKLRNVIEATTAYNYAKSLAASQIIKCDSLKAVLLTHFLCHSLAKKFISESDTSQICRSIPIADGSGHIILDWKAALIPATGSRWVTLLGSNPWAGEKYVELGGAYVECGNFAGEYSSKDMLLQFIELYIGAVDLPELVPPDAALPSASIGLRKEQAFILLDWLRFCRNSSLPQSNKFIRSIEDGMWLKTCRGYNSPNQCLLPNEELKSLLVEMGSVSALLPIIDEQFYDNKIRSYMNELLYIGVKFDSDKACRLIASTMSLGVTRLTRKVAIPLLKFISYSRQRHLLSDEMVRELQIGILLKTSQGYKPAIECNFLRSGTDPFLQVTTLPFVDATYYGEVIRQYNLEWKVFGTAVSIEEAYRLTVEKHGLPCTIPPLTKEVAISLLKFVRYLKNQNSLNDTSQDLRKSVTSLIITIRRNPWLKTNLGSRSPSGSFLFHPEWGFISDIVKVPLIDKGFYDDEIQLFKSELHLIGVVVDFASATKVIASQLKTLSSSFSLTTTNILSLLICIKRLKGTSHSPIEDFKNCLSNEKWLKTDHGYKFAMDTILFDSTWEPISQIADLPFIDDVFYDNCFYLYKSELKMMGVAVDLIDGVKLIAMGLKLPKDASDISVASVLSLLQCIQYILTGTCTSLIDEILGKIRGKWLKTCMGYRSPEECFLFDSSTSKNEKKWASILEPKDAPFIDEAFYGNDICLYKDELKAIGVKVDAGEGSAILADIVTSQTRFPVIKRIYKYLYKFKWKPQSKDNSTSWICIPIGDNEGGEWVHPSRCVLSDKDDLFGSRLHVLDNYYEKSLLPFFSSTFGVNSLPSTNDYITLWNDWEANSQHQVSNNECGAFWAYILDVWNATDAEVFTSRITKLPAKTSTDEIQLVDKKELFIPDDLQLEQMFSEANMKPIFVWYPQPGLASIALSRLYEVYTSLSVKKISESVEKGVDSFHVDPTFEMVDLKIMLNGEGLQRLVLGFLADLHLEISTKERHMISRPLIDLDVYGTKEPITVSYNLMIPYRTTQLSAKTSKMVSWEKDSNRLIVWKPDKSDHRSNIEFAYHFARAVSEGLLWEHTNHIEGLYKLIKSGCAYDFDIDAMASLLKMENLRVLPEDEEFLSPTFSSDPTPIENSSALSQHQSHKRKSNPPAPLSIVTRSQLKRGQR